jgi:cation-transporting P-type ATPase 13A2
MVGMCGDGANDCNALKTADVGLSLSDSEASIAAPFTSQTQNISAVVTLLREGRCSLTNGFVTFKFIELYAMTQFAGSITLYYVGAYFSNWHFIWQDFFLILPTMYLIGLT